jgi:NET1-associated nuclear protein 1 (U3 small nucleolar RNA-associated protein 17)
MSSPDAVEYDAFDETWQVGEEEREKRAGEYEAAQKALKKAVRRREHQAWRLSEPIAGRMINVDPAFTPGEKYTSPRIHYLWNTANYILRFLIVANRTTVNVYATSNSLLHRSIKLKLDTKTRARIITYCLSPSQDNILWVACSDGSIFSVDWTTGAGADQYWGISSTGCIHMTVASMESSGRRRDVVFTTEARKDGGWRITANELAPPNGQIKTEARTIYTSKYRVNFLKTENEGSIIVAASENRVLIGRLRSTDYDTVDKIKYEFRVFESSDHISSLDLRVSGRTGSGELKKSVRKLPVVDLVVGDVKGAIFLHTDLLAKLVMSQEGTLPSSFSITPKRMHWHRQAVLAVKWSLDGMYPSLAEGIELIFAKATMLSPVEVKQSLYCGNLILESSTSYPT